MREGSKGEIGGEYEGEPIEKHEGGKQGVDEDLNILYLCMKPLRNSFFNEALMHL